MLQKTMCTKVQSRGRLSSKLSELPQVMRWADLAGLLKSRTPFRHGRGHCRVLCPLSIRLSNKRGEEHEEHSAQRVQMVQRARTAHSGQARQTSCSTSYRFP